MARSYPRGRHPASLAPAKVEPRAEGARPATHLDPATMSSAAVAVAVRAYAERLAPQHPASFASDELHWYFEPAFGLENLGVTSSAWVAWLQASEGDARGRESLAREDALLAAGYAVDEGHTAAAPEALATWWRGRQAEFPIVVVEGRDGRPYVWNGMRRLGLAVRWGQRTVPAFVGIAGRPSP